MAVEVPKMRAYVNTRTEPAVEAHFRYLGPTRNEKPLASGEMRRQFGLKLRAQDACNLVYAMWRMEPQEKLVVSIKKNPGQHASAECGNRGYENIKPARTSALPPVREGEGHTLRAEMKGDELRVFADDREVWNGSVPAGAIEGPVGIRSDNVHLEFDLKARASAGTGPASVMPCKAGPEVAE
jgi:hypothetical protein